LASSATSEAERQKFEAKISAGERVNGAALIRSRTALTATGTLSGRRGSGAGA
jgi:hypothetical protein